MDEAVAAVDEKLKHKSQIREKKVRPRFYCLITHVEDPGIRLTFILPF